MFESTPPQRDNDTSVLIGYTHHTRLIVCVQCVCMCLCVYADRGGMREGGVNHGAGDDKALKQQVAMNCIISMMEIVMMWAWLLRFGLVRAMKC